SSRELLRSVALSSRLQVLHGDGAERASAARDGIWDRYQRSLNAGRASRRLTRDSLSSRTGDRRCSRIGSRDLDAKRAMPESRTDRMSSGRNGFCTIATVAPSHLLTFCMRLVIAMDGMSSSPLNDQMSFVRASAFGI